MPAWTQNRIDSYIGLVINNRKVVSFFDKITYNNIKNKQTFQYRFNIQCLQCKRLVTSDIHSIKRKGCSSCKHKRQPNKNSFVNARYSDYKVGAKSRGLTFSLTKDQFTLLINDNCYYCGVIPSLNATIRKTVFKLNGVDRVDNNIGYEPNNVVACCIICNKAKGTLSSKKFIEWYCRLFQYQIRKGKKSLVERLEKQQNNGVNNV